MLASIRQVDIDRLRTNEGVCAHLDQKTAALAGLQAPEEGCHGYKARGCPHTVKLNDSAGVVQEPKVMREPNPMTHGTEIPFDLLEYASTLGWPLGCACNNRIRRPDNVVCRGSP